MSHERRVVLANVSADDNRGGAAITFSTLSLIRDAIPGAMIEIVPAAGIRDVHHALRHTRAAFGDVRVLAPLVATDAASRLATEAARSAYRAARALFDRPKDEATLSRVVSADLVVTRGDALYVDRPTGRGLLSVAAASLAAVVAARWHAPAVLTGTEVGPFRHAPSRLLAQAILPRAGMIIVRNGDSYRHARDLGVPEDRLAVLPDTAFGFPRPDATTTEDLARRCGLPMERFAVVTVGSDGVVPEMDAFESRLGTLLRMLLDAAVIDQVAVVLQVDGHHISDRDASTRFVTRLADDRIRLVDEDLSPREVVALNGGAAMTLGTRMHSSILSLVAGTPTFPVAIWPKVRKLFEPLGLADSVIPFPDPDVDVLCDRISGVVRDPSARTGAQRIADQERERLGQFAQIINETVLPRDSGRPRSQDQVGQQASFRSR